MPDTLPNLKTAMDCWALAFNSCPRDMTSCHVHLSLVQWIRIARGSRIPDLIVEDCADQGEAHLQIASEEWDYDESMIVHFHIHDDWPPETLIIQSFENL